MVNQDLINYVISYRKIAYDSNFINILYQLFRNAVMALEKQIDFNYMEQATTFSLPAGSYSFTLTQPPYKVKKLGTLFDLTHNFELYGDNDVILFKDAFVNANTGAVPTRYYYLNDTLWFSAPLSENTTYACRFFQYTYNVDYYFQPSNTHPLIEENFPLLASTIGVYIDNYLGIQSKDPDIAQSLIPLEQNAQVIRRKIDTLIRIDMPRY